MKLQLRNNWQSTAKDRVIYLYPPNVCTDSASWYVDIDMQEDTVEVAAYPKGNRTFRVFSTIEEAHLYLIKCGSESPWEVIV